jgi:hypothetical protein
MTVAVIALTVFLSLQWKYWPYAGSLLLTGGAFGVWVAEILLQQFNHLGSSIVSLLIFCLALAWSTPVSIAHFGAIVLRYLWKMSRIVLTTLAFLAGMAIMRLMQAAATAVMRLMEKATDRARDGWENMRASQENRRQMRLEQRRTTSKKSNPRGEVEDAEVVIEGLQAEPPQGPGIQLNLPDPIVHSEAANALPELEEAAEKKAEQKTVTALAHSPTPSITSEPEILPPAVMPMASASEMRDEPP